MKRHQLASAFALALMFTLLQGGPALAETPQDRTAQATLGGGCFWCIEAVFEEVAGVSAAVSGYAGGHVDDPGYEAVCSGSTGHAEVVQVTYDPDVIGYEEILLVFFGVHDPTTLDRQGADRGTQYRSIILTHDADQQAAARNLVARLEAEGVYGDPIVTAIEPLERFWPAEPYHQDYYRKNPGNGYCMAVIAPKLAKFRQEFAEQRRR
jgi:peptide-methionine (S)-S-oxide reductase